jgi:hypothetical protein
LFSLAAANTPELREVAAPDIGFRLLCYNQTHKLTANTEIREQKEDGDVS